MLMPCWGELFTGRINRVFRGNGSGGQDAFFKTRHIKFLVGDAGAGLMCGLTAFRPLSWPDELFSKPEGRNKTDTMAMQCMEAEVVVTIKVRNKYWMFLFLTKAGKCFVFFDVFCWKNVYGRRDEREKVRRQLFRKGRLNCRMGYQTIYHLPLSSFA